MFGVRTSFPTTFWSAKTTFVPEAKEEIKGGSFEDDVEAPYHQEKMAIIETRAKLKEKTKEQKERAIPGMKLLKKITQTTTQTNPNGGEFVQSCKEPFYLNCQLLILYYY